MFPRSFAAASLAALCSLPLAAQTECPRQQAQPVPADLQYGPTQRCGSIDYQFGGLTVSAGKDGCPLFVIYTPPHDIAVPSEQRTQVVSTALQPITKSFFDCKQDWFLFIPVGTSCAFRGQFNVGTVQLLVTTSCPNSGAN